MLKNMRDIFCDCYILQSIDASNFNTSQVTNMQGMFARNYNLQYLDILNFNTNSAKK